MYGPSSAVAGSAAQGQKHDIFVGNLDYNTTEEQIHQVFSEIGRLVNVRMVTDIETGKPRGFAFVEFEDPQAALAAIRNMNDYELNGRRLRVNFSNSSHLEKMANELGMDLSSQQNQRSGPNTQTDAPSAPSAGTNAVTDALKGMSKAEMYDVVAKLKEIADKDVDEARRIISGHPQLPEALLFLMSKLDMVKTPLPEASFNNGMMPAVPPPPPPSASTIPAALPTRTADPRARAMDPRAQQAPADPRQRSADPRQASRGGGLPPPPPPPPPPMGYIPPPGPIGGPVDPALAQQVMALTPQQIAQLPPEKQQSILQLRSQLSRGM